MGLLSTFTNRIDFTAFLMSSIVLAVSRLLYLSNSNYFFYFQNCIELLWDEVAITLEQAYNILLDSDTSECSLEEYKVYSQCLRRGYRVQRCSSVKLLPKKKASLRESINPPKKVIISPLTGLRKSNDCSRGRDNIGIAGKNKCSDKLSHSPNKINLEEINIEEEDNNDNGMDDDSVKKVIENIISNLESKEHKTISDNQESHKLIKSNDHFKYELSETITSIPSENLEKQIVIKKNYNSKAEIISEESVSQYVKILKDVSRDNTSTENSASKWLGTRIKRNVKVLPKRVDQIPVSTLFSESSQTAVNENTNEMKRMRNALLYSSDCSACKKQRQEVRNMFNYFTRFPNDSEQYDIKVQIDFYVTVSFCLRF